MKRGSKLIYSSEEIIKYYSTVASLIMPFAQNALLGEYDAESTQWHYYGACTSEQTLIKYATQGMYECCMQNTHYTTRLVFVLSAPIDTIFVKIMNVAYSLKQSLDKRGISSYYMIIDHTVHIIGQLLTLYLKPMQLAQEIGMFVVARMHTRATMEWIEPLKQKKIYIDVSYNTPQSMLYVPYSLLKSKKISVAVAYSWHMPIDKKKWPLAAPNTILSDVISLISYRNTNINY